MVILNDTSKLCKIAIKPDDCYSTSRFMGHYPEFPKIQIITVADLLDGESSNVPQYETYYKIIEKYKIRNEKLQTKLDDMLPNNK